MSVRQHMEAPRLAALDGPLKGHLVALTKKLLLIGQGLDCDLRVPDPLASRRHCEITKNRGQFEVRDLGSTNGTFVNGKPIKRQRLKQGDACRYFYE